MRTKPGTKYPNLTGETTSAFRQACTPCQWHTWEGKGAWGPCRRPLPWHCHDSQLLIVHQSEGCLPENYLPKAFWGTGKCHAASPAFRSFCKRLLEAKNNHFWFFCPKACHPQKASHGLLRSRVDESGFPDPQNAWVGGNGHSERHLQVGGQHQGLPWVAQRQAIPLASQFHHEFAHTVWRITIFTWI